MIITSSPLRISLGGGGTDLPSYYREHTGFVISAAINKYVYITLHETFSEEIIVKYSKMETVQTPGEIKHPIVREALKLVGTDEHPHLEITSMSDIPAGTGLGSSGSFTTALLRALHCLKRNSVPARELAEQACHIELELLGEPIGKQDQYIAAYGGVCQFTFRKDESVDVKPFRRSPELFHGLSRNIMLFYTGRTRKAGNILSLQDQRTEANLEQLHCLKALALRTAEALDRMRLWEVGRVLNDGWQLKRQLAEGISNPEIEEMYDLALSAGAAGGKICGAGGGGFLLLYCDPAHHKAVRQAMEVYRELPIGLDPDGSKIIFQNRAGYRMASV